VDVASDNLAGIGLHILADTLGSVSVIISSLLILNYGRTIADPICSFGIAVLILVSVFPLLSNCAKALVQRTPEKFEKQLMKIEREVLSLEGVRGISNVHIWKQTGTNFVGTLHVQAANDANEQQICLQVAQFFKGKIMDLTIQVEKERFYQLQRQSQMNAYSLPVGVGLGVPPSVIYRREPLLGISSSHLGIGGPPEGVEAHLAM